MKVDRFVILTGNHHFFGQTRKPWVSMNVDQMVDVFKAHGWKPEVFPFHAVANGKVSIQNALVLYTFSQKVNRRQYILDVVRFLDDGTNVLIPRYDLLKCHENKGYQELYKRRLHIASLEAFYFSKFEEVGEYPIHYPMVLKSVDTSNGKGVFLVRSEKELKKRVYRLERQNIGTLLDLFRRKDFRLPKHYPEYPEYSNREDYLQYRDYILKEKNFILQEYVPGLDFDYRVVGMYGKYFVIKRFAFKGDFRASGTKKHDYRVVVEPSLLDFAESIFQKFDTPFLAMDIGVQNGRFCLFEFQALHFGINSILRTPGFYQKENSGWRFTEARSKIETELAEALVRYASAKGIMG